VAIKRHLLALLFRRSTMLTWQKGPHAECTATENLEAITQGNDMKLTAKARKAIPAEKFALPAERKYPINDHTHQVAAKQRASEMEHKGVISASTKSKIDAAANAAMGRSHGDGAPGSHWSRH
jgi:hypothetical protein